MAKFQAFGERLRRERTTRKLSQYEAAARFGVSQPSYHRWEAGQISPASRFRVPLAEFMGVSMDDLFVLLDPDHVVESHSVVMDQLAALSRRIEVLEEEVALLRR